MANYYVWFVRGAEHAAMCRTSIASVRKADRDASCIVVSDEKNPRWEVEALRLQSDPGEIMIANVDAQVQALGYVMRKGSSGKVTFLDTDTLLLKPFESFGDVDFTWRDSIGVANDGEKIEGIADRMPYNYGVVCSRPNMQALECFIWMRERIRQMHQSHQQWYGNQLAAVELAGQRPASGASAEVRQIPWRLTSHGRSVTIGKLPCEFYNYTPQKTGEETTKRFVLHFKGRRRNLMGWYAKSLGLPWEGPETVMEPEVAPLAVVNAL